MRYCPEYSYRLHSDSNSPFPLLPHTTLYTSCCAANNEPAQTFLHYIDFSPHLPDSCELSINTGPNFIPHFGVVLPNALSSYFH